MTEEVYNITHDLTLVLLNKLRCHTHFFWSQLIWIYTVYKGRVYPGSAGQGLSAYILLQRKLEKMEINAVNSKLENKWLLFRNIANKHIILYLP